MDYKIVLMRDAEEDLDRFIAYLLFEKKSEQAARNLLNDFEVTKTSLANRKYIYFSAAFLPGWESAAENFLRRKNCYSFCNSGKTFI